MSLYQIFGEYRGETKLIANDRSAAKALGFYRAAVKPGGLPMAGIRITDPLGIEIDAWELQRRAEAEQMPKGATDE